MEQTTETAGLDARVIEHIRCTARRLARTAGLPGMDADDIEQDLLLDLWQRRTAYDPARASFPTFADRVVAHRVATLTSPTARIRAERGLVSLDASDDGEDSTALVDSLADPTIPHEDERGLVLDTGPASRAHRSRSHRHADRLPRTSPNATAARQIRCRAKHRGRPC